MSDFCTCGAELPPDARFCHRCGKPQREEPIPESAEPPPAANPSIPPAASVFLHTAPPAGFAPPPRVTFKNPTAVRIALIMGGITSLLSTVTGWAFGMAGLALSWVTAGFIAAYLYRRRTGQFLNVDNGLRLGWITGLLGSTITAVVFTISIIPLIRGGQIASLYEEQFHRMYGNDPKLQQALQMLQNPASLALVVVFVLLFLFLMITFLATAGGALGAKMVGRTTGPRA